MGDSGRGTASPEASDKIREMMDACAENGKRWTRQERKRSVLGLAPSIGTGLWVRAATHKTKKYLYPIDLNACGVICEMTTFEAQLEAVAVAVPIALSGIENTSL